MNAHKESEANYGDRKIVFLTNVDLVTKEKSKESKAGKFKKRK